MSDTGIGMQTADIPHALEPFGQGHLSVESTPGRGTTVTVTLPAERARLAEGGNRAMVATGEVKTSARVVPITAATRGRPRLISP